jgi:hypothetical protein
MPTLFGFRQNSNRYTKVVNPGMSLTLYFGEKGIAILQDNKKDEHPVKFVHQFQNAYFNITSTAIQPNLYGVKE